MSEELKQLITWFENYQVTFNEIRLSECENIFDLSKYIDVHVRSVKRNWDNPTFASDILRLQRLKRCWRKEDKVINNVKYLLFPKNI